MEWLDGGGIFYYTNLLRNNQKNLKFNCLKRLGLD